MSRNSLEYAFLPGASLWTDAKRFTPMAQCAVDVRTGGSTSDACKRFLAGSEKARLQWKLEEDFKSFEGQY